MKKIAIKVITLIIIGNFLISCFYIAIFAKATPISIKVDYGSPPVIDGFINRGENEWNNAVKNDIYLYPNLSNPINGLLVKLWLLQTEEDLYFSVQFELQNHNSEEYLREYVAVLIADDDTATQDDFIDAKIVKFNNVSSGDFYYSDSYIQNSIFIADLYQNGIGAAELDQNEIVYEFSIPIRNNQNQTEDVYLNYGGSSKKVFKIVFGTDELSFDKFLVQNDLLIELQFPPFNPPLSLTEILLITFNFIIFGTTGVIIIFYIYRITQLKKEIRRIKR